MMTVASFVWAVSIVLSSQDCGRDGRLLPSISLRAVLTPDNYKPQVALIFLNTQFQHWESLLICRLEQFHPKLGPQRDFEEITESKDIREFEEITRLLAHYKSAQTISALIGKLNVFYFDWSNPPTVVIREGIRLFQGNAENLIVVRPAGKALAIIGDPAVEPLVDAYLRAADDPKKVELCTAIIITLEKEHFVARALNDAMARLYLSRGNKKMVRECEELIALLVFNDRNDEIADFKAKLPASWWKSWLDKFKEEEHRAQAAKKKRISRGKP